MVFLEPPKTILKLLRDALPTNETNGNVTDFGDSTDEIVAYIATLASSLATSQTWDSNVWVEELTPYLITLPSVTDENVEDIIANFCSAANTAMNSEEDSSDEEDEFGGEEITNIRFSLAYGGKILLHQTKLRLRRGHRYALVGQNGVGKTTLMNAVNNGKLEGWPTELKTEYVDSGSNVDPVHEAKIVFGELQSATGKSSEECKGMLEQLKFTETMMQGTIGELSGGWQMKLRLAQAVLIDADILLMDEPTNHLDSKTVKWLEDYLTGLKETTVLIVSHDTVFLENVCSDGKYIMFVFYIMCIYFLQYLIIDISLHLPFEQSFTTNNVHNGVRIVN